MFHSIFVQASTDGNLGCFQILAIVNSAAMNTGTTESSRMGLKFPALYHSSVPLNSAGPDVPSGSIGQERGTNGELEVGETVLLFQVTVWVSAKSLLRR